MDRIFHPAMKAIEAGDLDELTRLVRQNPALATLRSRRSHPSLLQCLVLSGNELPHKIEMMKLLLDNGADLHGPSHGPLVAAVCVDNVEAAEYLLDRGAKIDGVTGWAPIEEALYWNARQCIELLVARDAKIGNLRIAAGLGRTDVIEQFFDQDDNLKPEAGQINWPWGSLDVIEDSNQGRAGKASLAGRFKSWSQDRQGIINNAFIYACMHGQLDAAKLLLEKGAQINVIPGGFDYAGTGLHYGALNGHREIIEFLLAQGADSNIKDTKVGGTPAGWAEYGGHQEIADYLKRRMMSKEQND
jgi:ankyrin repeat protein